MAAERRSQSGLLVAWAVSRIVGCIPFNLLRVDPVEDNPFKEARPVDEGLARAKEYIAKRMWAAATRTARG